MKLPILTAADGAQWEQRVVGALAAAPSGVTVARRCVDVVDLLAVAASGQGRAALVDCALPRLDVDAVDRLRAGGVAVIAVVPRDDPAAELGVRALGIEFVVAHDADPQVINGVVLEAVRAVERDAPAGRGARRAGRHLHPGQNDGTDDPGHAADSDHAAGFPDVARHGYADPSVSLPIPPGEARAESPDPAREGTVVAVWGPTGAPGRTTLAVTLADELNRLGRASLLIDADVYGGTVAAVLGLLDDSPGIAAACRQAGGQRLDAGTLAAACWQLGPRLRVLTGIPLASRWPELRPAAVGAVLASARSLADVTVVDCGFCLETDEELSFDTLAPRRNGATLAVLDEADLVLVVGSADPIGMQRLVRALAELRDTEIDATTWVVLNRVRDGVVPGRPAEELSAALERFAGRTPAALLPADARALDAALAEGRLLGEASPDSPLRRSVVELAAAIAGVAAPAPRRGWRRLAGRH